MALKADPMSLNYQRNSLDSLTLANVPQDLARCRDRRRFDIVP